MKETLWSFYDRAVGGNTSRCNGSAIEFLTIITIDESEPGQLSDYPILKAAAFPMAMPGVISARSGFLLFPLRNQRLTELPNDGRSREKPNGNNRERWNLLIPAYLNHWWNLKSYHDLSASEGKGMILRLPWLSPKRSQMAFDDAGRWYVVAAQQTAGSCANYDVFTMSLVHKMHEPLLWSL